MENDVIVTYYIVSLLFSAGLALIPANVAKNKGHSFGLWWFYGFMLFVIAIIHVNFIDDVSQPLPSFYDKQATNKKVNVAVLDELKKYKELLEKGVITESEYQAKKEYLLKTI